MASDDWAGVTMPDQIGLVMSTVRGLNDLASDSYTYAKQQLDVLAAADMALSMGVVDVNIGDNADINWTGTYTAPDTPVEPDYSADVDEPTFSDIVTPNGVVVGDIPTLTVSDPTIPDVVVPAGVSVGDAPVFSVDLSGAPTAPTLTLGDIPTLDTLPEIAVTIPTMDVGLLSIDPLDDFSEPTYTERVSAEVEAGIKAVLGGSLGLPSSYWSDLWAQTAADLTQQSAGEARRARNTGAASFWARPSEVVDEAARRVLDEGSKKLTLAKLEQAKSAAVFAREDFWQAISKGIEYENQWIGAFDKMAQRSLVASEQLYGIRVQVHNANINRYNAMLEAAKLDGTIDDMQVRRVLSKLEAELKASAQEVSQDGLRLEEFKTRWEGYRIDKTTQVTVLAEQVKFWNGVVDADIRYQTLGFDGAKIGMDLVKTKVQKFGEEMRGWIGAVDADTKYQGLTQGRGKLDLDLMVAQVGKIQGLAVAAANMLKAREGIGRFEIDKQLVQHNWDKDINLVEVELTKISQAAQESRAKIDVAQAEWLALQSISLKTNIAQLAYGFSQAAVAASDVGLSSSVGLTSGSTESSSHNAELVW